MTSIEVVGLEFGGLATLPQIWQKVGPKPSAGYTTNNGRMSSNKNADIHGRPQWI